MVRQSILDQMTGVGEALYLREYERIRAVLEEEARITAQIARLDDQVLRIRAEGTGDHGYRSVGADILWQSWESRTRRQLNSDLARARAKRLSMMDELKRAFGRKQAIAQIAEDEKSARVKARRKAELDALCRDAVLR
ncbi:hypothetical protein [Ruegeria pomeroyi]|uniref:hypothetical protein n=1 Tax=Ruegeria pomeroyi TaxID=89184 RepID=UPI001F2488C7|nr:hypothetical protein [Ruegeria pomeroyi]